MTDYNYCLAYDDGNILIRYAYNKPIQRYDRLKGKWVTDWDMTGIFSGDIPCKMLTEQEANKRIRNEQYS